MMVYLLLAVGATFVAHFTGSIASGVAVWALGAALIALVREEGIRSRELSRQILEELKRGNRK